MDLHEVHPQFTSPGAIENKILKLQDVGLYYKKQAIVEHINLSAGIGEIIGVVGHNGAGKSTLARCLCGLEKHCRGIVSIAGKQYNRKRRLRYCYMVMQDVNHQLFTESVNDEVLLSMKNPDADQVSSTLKELDLDAFSERHPMSLSGGQKQRVAIASALVSDREILVFDEPTSGLDLLHMSEVAKQLETLRRMQKTSIVITHDYELIVSCCTHILHLEHGEVQAQYPLDEAGADRLKKFFIEMEWRKCKGQTVFFLIRR